MIKELYAIFQEEYSIRSKTCSWRFKCYLNSIVWQTARRSITMMKVKAKMIASIVTKRIWIKISISLATVKGGEAPKGKSRKAGSHPFPLIYYMIFNTSPLVKKLQNSTVRPINSLKLFMQHALRCLLEMTTEQYCAITRLQVYFLTKILQSKVLINKTTKILLFATTTLPVYMPIKRNTRSKICTLIKQFR